MIVSVRPVRRRFRRAVPPEPVLTLGPDFFAVLARVPEGWTQTLDALRSEDEVVWGSLQIRMAVTELSRISPYAESSAEQAEFNAFRELVGSVPAESELVLRN